MIHSTSSPQAETTVHPKPWPVAEFGFLTLATPNDYLKAVALALSLRVSNPGISIAVACSPRVRPLIEGIFDIVIDEDPTLRGFVHKVHLDRYTPFRTTVFFDSDVLVFRPVKDFIGDWPTTPYVACGIYLRDGLSSFGLDRARALGRLGRSRMTVIDGAGHALFHMPQAAAVFERAREITADYARIGGGAQYADEDVMNIVMTEADMPPANSVEFFSRFLSGRSGTVRIDAAHGQCVFTAMDSGLERRPCMMHFAANEAPVHYGLAMWQLFGHAGHSRSGLISMMLGDAWHRHVRGNLRRLPGFPAMRRALARVQRRELKAGTE